MSADGCDDRRSRVPQARASSSTSSSTARRRCRSSSIPNTKRCSARAASRRAARRPICSIPDLSPRAPRIAPREPVSAEPAAVAPRQAAPPLSARPARVAARRRRRARRRCATRSPASRTSRRRAACARSGGPSARCFEAVDRERARARLRRRSSSPRASTCRSAASSKAARRSPTGCGAKCSITSRSARRSAPQVQAVQRAFRLVGTDPVARRRSTPTSSACSRCCAKRASSSRGAKDTWLKFASGRAENLPKLKADAARRCTRRPPRSSNGALMKLTAALVERLDKMPASRRVRSRSRWSTRPRCCSPRARSRTTRASRSEFPKQVDAMLARLDAARAAADPRRHRRADARRDEQARAGARAARAGRPRDPGQPAAHGAGARRVLPRQRQARRPRDAEPRTATQIRGALSILGLDDAERLLGLCQEQIESYANPRDAGQRRRPRASRRIAVGPRASTSRRVEQQRPDRERLIAPLIAKRLGEAPRAGRPRDGDRSRTPSRSCARMLPALVDEVRRAPADAAARAALTREARGPARRRRADRRRGARRAQADELGAAGARAPGGRRRHRRAGGRRRDRRQRSAGRAPARALGGNAAAARDRRATGSTPSSSRST